MRPSDVSTTPTLGRDARSSPDPHSPQSAPEEHCNHQGRSIEASPCDPRPYASRPRLAASAERSGVHRCGRRTSPQRQPSA
eukprot:5250479-Prymnesium_polylepis.1